MFSLCYSGVFMAWAKVEGGRDPIPPFSFQVSGVNRLLFAASSENIKDSWWSAGWIDLVLLDASFPTFQALEKWQKLPLKECLFLLPSTAAYKLIVKPNSWIVDLSLKVWADGDPLIQTPIIDGGLYE